MILLLYFTSHLINILSMEEDGNDLMKDFVITGTDHFTVTEEDFRGSLYHTIAEGDETVFKGIKDLWNSLDDETKAEVWQYKDMNTGETAFTLAVILSIRAKNGSTDGCSKNQTAYNIIEDLFDMGDPLVLNGDGNNGLIMALKLNATWIIELYISKRNINILQQAIIRCDKNAFDSIIDNCLFLDKESISEMFRICSSTGENALTLAVKSLFSVTSENIEQSIFYYFIEKLLNKGADAEEFNCHNANALSIIFWAENSPLVRLFLQKRPYLKQRAKMILELKPRELTNVIEQLSFQNADEVSSTELFYIELDKLLNED